MPWYVAVDFNNNKFKKDRVKDVKFFSLPKNKNLKGKWLANIQRENNLLQNRFTGESKFKKVIYFKG